MKHSRKLLSLLTLFSACTPPIQKNESHQIAENALPRNLIAENIESIISKNEWWRALNDQELSRLIETARSANLTIQQALDTLYVAECEEDIAKSYLYPSLDLLGTASRKRIAKNLRPTTQISIPIPPAPAPTPPPAAPPGHLPPPAPVPAPSAPTTAKFTSKPPKFVNFLRLHLYLNYELDIWGKYILGVRAADETTKSFIYDVQNIELDITTEVANNYFAYRKAVSDIAVFEKSLSMAVERFTLEHKRAEAGLTADFETLLASEAITGIAIQLAEARANQESSHARLATLCAVPQDLFSIEAGSLPTPLPIPRTIHCNLLNQRPDIQRLSHLVEAARLQIGIAKVAFLPDFTINPYIGFEAQKANKLFKWQNRVWSLSGQMLYNLFNGFQSTALLEEARYEYERSLNQYLERVLVAAQEVHQALAFGESLSEAYDENRVKLQFIGDRLLLRQRLYDTGIESKPPLLDVTLEFLQQEEQVTIAQFNQLTAWLQLVKSIGGAVPRK